MKIIQIWCAEKNMGNNLVDQMKSVVKKNKGLGLASIGGCGGFGNFTGVYSAYIKGQPTTSKINQIIADLKKITCGDGAHVTEAVLSKDIVMPKSVMQYWEC